MNGFERHGINHLSASSINMYADCAGAWAARYIFNKKFKFGAAAQVGVLTEKVVQGVLLGSSFDDALEQAHKTFQKNNALNMNEKDLNRMSDIKPMAELALDELLQYGEPEFIHKINGVDQQKIEINCNCGGWSIPLIGCLDFVYPKHGLIVDLKTTLRMPSEMSMAHKRQGAIYKAASGNKSVKFLYVTPKKSNVFEIEDYKEILENTKVIVKRMERMLSLLDKDQIKDLIPVNASSFYWSGDEDILKELYGL